ncbi:HK97-gp10 family putative phage morphogenesis protein [Agrobacterium cavarae]|uniref:HK97-gp10 family putative phage morphogenesis protein n=1 Tax=Agrobacterium cavarae TaxID=2528239 RepID=UPI003FD130D8
MENKSNNGLAETMAAFDRIARAPREAVIQALAKEANKFADTAEGFAESSRDTGALIDSISVTMPGRSTPPFSQPGGSRIAGETEVIVTVGDTNARYAHLVEYGTSETEAQPFFWPAYRLLKNGMRANINRAVKKAVRDAWKNQ